MSKDKNTIDLLMPGQSVELVPVLQIGELNPKWWQVWKPFIFRDATPEEVAYAVKKAKEMKNNAN